MRYNKKYEVESITLDDDTWLKVTTKDWITIWIVLSDVATILRAMWNNRQRILWEIMEHLSWEDKKKLISIHLDDTKWALEESILYKRIDNWY